MPIIDITVPQDVFGSEAKDRLVEEICSTVLKWEKIEDNLRSRGVTWAYLTEQPARLLYIGGQPTRQPMFRLTITTPQGMLDDTRKAEMVAELTLTVLMQAGLAITRQNQAQVWCIIQEVPSGNWGAGSRMWNYEQIRDLVGLEQTAPVRTSYSA